MLRLLSLLAVLLLPTIALADGMIVIDNAPPRPDHFAFAPLEVTYHHVEVEIDDRVAVTRIDQEFYNSNPQRLEGTYLFPLPEGATIDKFSMDINGKMTAAELLDAKKARETYEEIVRKYRDPALLEYVGRGAMKARIFPIEPNSKKRIQISYTQVLRGDSAVMEYVYPLNTEKFSARPLKEVSIKVKLACNTPIRSIYSPTHEVEIRRDGDRRATVGFEAKDARPDIDFKLIVTREPDPIGISLLTYRDRGNDGYFMLLASPGAEVASEKIQPKDICFVLDTSGSMAGAKLEQAKKALLFCLENLNEGDRFEIIRFSTEVENLFGTLSEANRQNVRRAGEFIEKLKPIGGTAIDEALQKALALPGSGDRPYQIIFLTDGQPTVGETNEDRIVTRLTKPDVNVRVFPFGVGTDVNTTLLDRIANDTHALSQYVLPNEDIELKVSSFYTRVQSPVLNNVKLTCNDPGVRLKQVYPGVLPDLFKGETLIAFGRYELVGSGPRRATITLSGQINGMHREITSEVFLADNDTTYDFVPRLWATRRVGWLLDEIRLRGESKELVDEVTQLAREHGIVTPYTAYLILEDERRRDVPVALRTMRELDQDAAARTAVSDFFGSANAGSGRLEKTGDRAVANAQTLNSLKFGVNVQQAQQPLAMGKTSPLAQQAQGYKVAQNYAQQVRVVRGRAFYQNGAVWTDATAQSQQNLKRREINFNSEEYFALLARHPSAAQWLSLGNQVDLVLDDTLYVVR